MFVYQNTVMLDFGGQWWFSGCKECSKSLTVWTCQNLTTQQETINRVEGWMGKGLNNLCHILFYNEEALCLRNMHNCFQEMKFLLWLVLDTKNKREGERVVPKLKPIELESSINSLDSIYI